jgi:hypothetical protein
MLKHKPQGMVEVYAHTQLIFIVFDGLILPWHRQTPDAIDGARIRISRARVACPRQAAFSSSKGTGQNGRIRNIGQPVPQNRMDACNPLQAVPSSGAYRI